ncbi:PLDc N-terminal domain-containing protein [Streptomyces sp. NPDC051940]|uniref:PLDc N-terminal domain-containing protein n=1 Tax=Streptomyces sp. NPDC051940 TaxID=3155675 RepID=UPI00343983AE
MLRFLPFLVVLALWIYAFIDCLNTPEDKVRNLPKVAWVVIIVLFGYLLFGSVAWLIAGRPRREALAGGSGSSRGGGRSRGGWVAPDDNPDFLRSLDPDKRPDTRPEQHPDQRPDDGPEDERRRRD